MTGIRKADQYMVEVAPGRPASAGKPATGPELRSWIAKDGPPTSSEVTTLYEMFQRSVNKFGSKPCLGKRVGDGEYTWLTYQQVSDQSVDISSALSKLGVTSHGRAGIYGANSPEWMVSMQACNRMGVYCVPLYDTLGENAIEYIINHSEASILFSQSEKLPMLVKALPKVKDQIKAVVYWGAENAAAAQAAKDLGLTVYTFDEFLALGKANPSPATPPKAEDLCTIMYTSGTTGDPKGVMLTHNAVLSTVLSLVRYISELFPAYESEDWVFLSFLPLAHIFDRASEEFILYLGGQIGYWRGDIKGLVDDIGALKPTMFAGVPRVFDRIYSGVMQAVNSGSAVKRFLFNWGYNRKLHALDNGAAYDKASPFFDKLVFGKIKEKLGGRVKIVISGGAPLARHVEDFLRVNMCCYVVQGYGLTETAAASFIAVPDVPEQAGTVGPVQPVISCRLEAVPEMNYDPTANPPRGEVCVKGPAVFKGYYKADDKTAEVLDADGWFHTGDIGEFTPHGALRIIDRKKNIFKLSQGEYIAVEKIEDAYKKCASVEQIWVYGNSFESSLVAVVVPKPQALQSIGTSLGISGSPEALTTDNKVKKALLDQLTGVAKEAKLKGFEMVRAIYVTLDQFTVENDLATPTYKLKRPQLQKKYQEQIDAMYAAMKQQAK